MEYVNYDSAASGSTLGAATARGPVESLNTRLSRMIDRTRGASANASRFAEQVAGSQPMGLAGGMKDGPEREPTLADLVSVLEREISSVERHLERANSVL